MRVCVYGCFSHVQLFATLWTKARKAPLSMGFSRQEYCSGLSFLSPEDLLDPGIEPGSPTLQADNLPSDPPGEPRIFPYSVYSFCMMTSHLEIPLDI